jgi:hypothetical protein
MEYDFYHFVEKNFEMMFTRAIENDKLKDKGYFYEKIYGPNGKIVK